jgi:hypothetical protein
MAMSATGEIMRAECGGGGGGFRHAGVVFPQPALGVGIALEPLVQG